MDRFGRRVDLLVEFRTLRFEPFNRRLDVLDACRAGLTVADQVAAPFAEFLELVVGRAGFALLFTERRQFRLQFFDSVAFALEFVLASGQLLFDVLKRFDRPL